MDRIKTIIPDKINGILSHWPVESSGKIFSKPPWLSFINSIKNLILNKISIKKPSKNPLLFLNSLLYIWVRIKKRIK